MLTHSGREVAPSWRKFLSCIALAASLAACGGHSGDDDPATPPGEQAQGRVSGVVTDALTGQPVSGAQVRIGTLGAQTGADGRFTLGGVEASDRAVVTVEAPGYAAAFEVTPVVRDAARSVDAQLLPLGATGTVAAASGGRVTVPGSTAAVELPANGLVRPDGRPASGSAQVQLTVINPAANPGTMPGDFTARTAGGERPMESFGAIVVEIRDASGAELNLAPGKTATIRIPVGTRAATPPATLPLFHFDEASGYWIQEGSATLVGSGAQAYYEGTVAHFSTWNADQVIETVRLTGCVKDESGAPVPRASIFTDGIDYSGSSSAVAGADGCFQVPIKRNAKATLVGTADGKLTNTLSKGPYARDTVLDEFLVVNQKAAAVSIRLTWGERPEDLDAHLHLPDGSYVHFGTPGSLTKAPWAQLDVDDTDSFGPEVMTIRKPMVGTYRYLVHNFARANDPATGGSVSGTPARIELNIDGQRQFFTPPAGEGNQLWWLAFELEVDARCRVTVKPLSTWATVPPAPAAETQAVYCTP